MNGSKIGDNCKIIESIIGENVTIGDSCELFNCVIGDNVIIDKGTILNDQKSHHHKSVMKSGVIKQIV